MSNIAKAKLMVMRSVPYIQKTGKMNEGPARYTFAKETDFIAALHPAMCEAGLTISVASYELIGRWKWLTRNQTRIVNVVIKGRFRLTHAESGETEETEAFGEGADVGDKAFNKAMTIAMKYALRQLFLVETGDDPDNTPSSAHEEDVVATTLDRMRRAIINSKNLQNLKEVWRVIYQDRGIVGPAFAEIEKLKDRRKQELQQEEGDTAIE